MLDAEAVSAGSCFVGNEPESSAPSGWTVDGESVVGGGTVGVEEESASYTRSVVVDRRLNVSGLVAQAQIRGGSPHGGVTVVRSSRL